MLCYNCYDIAKLNQQRYAISSPLCYSLPTMLFPPRYAIPSPLCYFLPAMLFPRRYAFFLPAMLFPPCYTFCRCYSHIITTFYATNVSIWLLHDVLHQNLTIRTKIYIINSRKLF
jgi:hypothetical protein